MRIKNLVSGFLERAIASTSTSRDRTLKIWNADDGNHIKTFNGHMDSVYDIDFSLDGHFIATAGYDRKIGLFEIGKEEGKLFKGHEGEVTSVMFDSSGKQLISAGKDGTVHLWSVDPESLNLIRNFPKSTDTIIAAISPDGSRVATGGRDMLMHIFNAADGTEIHRFAGHENMIYRVEFSPDGEQVATVSADGTIQFWDLGSFENLFTLKLPSLPAITKPLWDFSFRCTPTGSWIVVPLTRGKVVVYRMDNFYE